MKILIASDKFKGSLTATEACRAIREGLADALGDRAGCTVIPVADGGEGMAHAISEAKGGSRVETEASDPLGRPVQAGYGWIAGESLAVIEMAEASGLWRIGEAERDPWRASTFGTGQLIRHAVEEYGARKLLLGIGGSATNDGGVGVAVALGYRFVDVDGAEVTDLPADLEKVVAIDSDAVPALPQTLVACDVTNPLLGENGCTRVYGPQKGVAESEFRSHENRLRHLIELTGAAGEQAAAVQGSGAAGGLGFGSLVFLNAELRPGFDLVAETLDLDAAVRECDLVITGEGRLDRQTLQGKAPAGVAALARKRGKPVVAFAGMVDYDSREELNTHFDGFFQIAPQNLTAGESMARGAELLTRAVCESAELLPGITCG